MPGLLSRAMRERLNQLQSLSSNPYNNFGLYFGYVVSHPDPDSPEFAQDQLGRVRVRVPSLHHDSSHTPDDVLPWAIISGYGGGTKDCGSYEPPYIGAKVVVGFLQGDPDYPVILGTWGAQPLKQSTVVVAGEKVTVASGLELPLETDGYSDTKQVWRKSFKGHTIICEEASESEYLRIIDRAGNIIELRSPMEDASQRRGVGNAIDGGAASPKDMSGDAYIQIKDIAGQSIKMTIDERNPEIVISTPGVVRIGGESASYTFALARLLYNALRPVLLALQNHIHPHPEGNTGPPAQRIPDLPAAEAWDTPTIYGEQQ